MSKPLRITTGIIGGLFSLYIILGLTNILKIYNNPTTANEPGIKLNSKIFVSNLASFKNGDFVCYKYEDEILGKHIRIHRLLGKANDVIEIKDGILFINGENFDKKINLKHFYLIETDKLEELIENKILDNKNYHPQVEQKIMVSLVDNIAKQYGVSKQIIIRPKNQIDQLIQKVFNHNWNMDNFGPLKIPEGKCFLIGDNRHNSQDSRYIGLIDESSIVGTVIKK